MADCFEGVPIKSQDQQPRDLVWLRTRFGLSPQVVLDGWRIVEVWEQDGAMSCGVQFLAENGDPLVDLPVIIGWYDTQIPARTRDRGWVDVPIAGGDYSNTFGTGPMFIRTPDGRFAYTGIGWVRGTNHSHINLIVQRGHTAPPPPPPPPNPGVPLELLRADLEQARAAIVQALGRLP